MATNKPISDQEIDAKIDALDEDVEVKEDEKVDDTQQPSDKPDDEDTPADDQTEGEGGNEDEAADDDAGSDNAGEDDGYTIDEDDEEVDAPKTDDAPVDKSKLNPEQQYILDNISPVKVRGRIGDGQIQTFEVYAATQLPEGFKYVDDRENSVANTAFNLLENEAQRLQNDYRGQESQKVAKEFKEREDSADRADIGRLQREGDLPRFKAQPNTKDFDSDPATVLIQEVLDFKEQTNARYLDEYNAGRPYKHIGFEEAFKMFQRENPTKGNAAQKQEDQDRKKIAQRSSKGRGSDNNEVQAKPRVHSGMGSMDLDRLIEDATRDW